MHTRFISDIHLDPDRTRTYGRFCDYLASIRDTTDRLFILGDLFEYWIGDDAVDDLRHGRAVEVLKETSDAGVKIHVMHGNRDFLIGEGFAASIDAALIPDPTIIELNGERTLVMHGDSLCTDDVEHQKFRAVVNDEAWQSAILSLSIDERRERAVDMRKQSEMGKSAKDEAMMDVNGDAVVSVMERMNVQTLIHGHVHKPGIHRHLVNERPAVRYVLGDWDSGRDGVLSVSPEGIFELHAPG